jgi:hypothetical protein
MKKPLIITLLLTACTGEVKTVATEETKPITDSVTCSATVNKVLILNDSELLQPKIILADTNITATLNKYLEIEKIGFYTLKELKEQRKDSFPMGLTALGYEITFNKNCLLSMTVYGETMGAYPSGYSLYFNFDLTTGDSVFIEKLLDETKINTLIKRCDDTIQKRIAECKAEHTGTDDGFILEQLVDKKFTRKELSDFYITETDVVFVYSFGFPHVIQGAEPDGFIKIPKGEFRQYLKTNPYRF